MTFIPIWLLIWLLGVMLGVNCIQIGAAHLLPRRELPESWRNAMTCVPLARSLGIILILAGILLIYAVCAGVTPLPGHSIVRRILLM